MTITAHSSLEKTRKFVFLFCEAESRPLRQRTPCEAPVETQLRETSPPGLHPRLARVYTLAHRERRKKKTGKKKRDNGGVGRGRSLVRVARGTTATVVPGPPARVRPPRPLLPLLGAQPRAVVTRRRSFSSGPRNPGLSRGRATSALIAVTNRRPAGKSQIRGVLGHVRDLKKSLTVRSTTASSPEGLFF